MALVILFRKQFRYEPLAYLLTLCMVSFFKEVLTNIGMATIDTANIIANVYFILKFIIIMLLYRSAVKESRAADVLTVFLVAFSSILITYLVITGAAYNVWIHAVQSSILLIASLIAFYFLLRDHSIQIFQSPLFWVGCGVFFFNFQFLIIEVCGTVWMDMAGRNLEHKWILMIVTTVVEYLFFLAATLVYSEGPKDDKLIKWRVL
ncbi:MAG TPA: hypothetical protein VIK74_06675 [Parasegetibacter sp.]